MPFAVTSPTCHWAKEQSDLDVIIDCPIISYPGELFRTYEHSTQNIYLDLYLYENQILVIISWFLKQKKVKKYCF